MSQQHILVLDTETTGLVDPINIVEVSWCEIDEELSILGEFSSLVKAPTPITCSASGVNGVRDEDLVNEPTIDQIPFPDGDIVIIGHNVSFDYPLVEPYMNIVGQICTLILARRLLPDAPDYRLGTLSCYCGLPRQLNHRALGDVRDCLGLLDFMMREHRMNLQEVYDYVNTPMRLKTMPFGKHKGLPIEQVPLGYIQWLLGSNERLDQDLRYTIKCIWGI